MLVKDVFTDKIDIASAIAKAIYIGMYDEEDYDDWICNFYKHIEQLKNTDAMDTNNMLALSTERDSKGVIHSFVSCFEYDDILHDELCYCDIECMEDSDLLGLFLPEETVKVFGTDTIVSEVLNESGWHDYYDEDTCPIEIYCDVKLKLMTMGNTIPCSNDDPLYTTKIRKEFFKHKNC